MASRRLKRLRESRQGSATVEFVLWIPFFLLLVGVLVDATLLMHRQTRMYEAARAAARQVSLGLMDEAAAEDFARSLIGGAAEVRVQGDLVTTSVSQPVSQVIVFGSRFLSGSALSASVVMVQEAPDADAED